MSKTALAIGVSGLLFASISMSASAMPVMPMSNNALTALHSDIDQIGWRRCWRDRWGRRHCRWCWRDRWGRIQCR
jgi:hypothetical protein